MTTIDIPIPAHQIRQGDHIVPADGTVRVVVGCGTTGSWTWLRAHGDEAPHKHDADESIVLRCPLTPGGGYGYYAEQHGDHTTVYRHVGAGRFEEIP